MIPASPGARITLPDAGSDWRQSWRDAVTDAGELLALLGLIGRRRDGLACQSEPLSVPIAIRAISRAARFRCQIATWP